MKNNCVKIIILAIIILFVVWLGFFIGIDFSIKTLLIVMTIDYLIGMALAITGNSKHGDGGLSSSVGYEGLIKKIIILLLVGLIAVIESYLLSHGVQFEYIKDMAIVAFIINEVISVVENVKFAGLEVPEIFTKFIDNLKNIRLKK